MWNIKLVLSNNDIFYLKGDFDTEQEVKKAVEALLEQIKLTGDGFMEIAGAPNQLFKASSLVHISWAPIMDDAALIQVTTLKPLLPELLPDPFLPEEPS